MKQHSRSQKVTTAKLNMDMAILDISDKFDLTFVEKHQILLLHMASDCKHMIRQERHPDEPDKGGDIA